MKKIHIIIFALITSISFSQNCYKTNIDLGIKKYNSKKYTEALTNFSNAKKCSDAKGITEPNNWINKCNTEINKIENNRLQKLQKANDLKAFEKAEEINTISSYDEYLKSFSSGDWVDLAISKLNDLIYKKDLGDYQIAKTTNTKIAFENYLNNYPKGNWMDDAKLKIKEIEAIEESDFKAAVNTNTLQTFYDYQKKHPNSSYNSSINQKIKKLTFSKKIGSGHYSSLRYSATYNNQFNRLATVTNWSTRKENKGFKLRISDIRGKVISDELFFKGNYTSQEDIKKSNDDGFVVLSHYESDSEKGFWVFGYKDKVLWEKMYPYNEFTRAKKILITDDGSLFVIGEKVITSLNTASEQKDVFITKLNSKGDFLWTKTFGGANFDKINSAVKTKDSKIVLAGSTKSLGQNDSENFWVLKLNLNGDIVWEKAFGGNYDDYATKIIEFNDEELLLVGNSKSYNNGNSKTWLLKINNNGDELWSKYYNDNNDIYEPNITSDRQGNIIMATTDKSDEGVVLVKLDNKGIVKNSKRFKVNNCSNQTNYLGVSKDNGVIFMGKTHNNQQEVWLVKADSNFNVHKETNSIQIFEQEIKQVKEEGSTLKNWKEQYSDVEVLLPLEMYQVKLNGKYGLVDINGKVIAHCLYKKFSYAENDGYYKESEGLNLVYSYTDEHLVLFNNMGKQIISAKQNLTAFYGVSGAYGSNVLRVQGEDYRWGGVDVITGELVIPTIYKGMFAWDKDKQGWSVQVSLYEDMKNNFTLNQKGKCIKKCKNQ